MTTNTELFGFCRTAHLVESGEVQSTTDASGWHAMCPGAVQYDKRIGRTQGNPGHVIEATRRCSCDCHAEQHHCIVCHATDTELDEGGLGVKCADTETCAARRHEQLLQSPRYQQILEAKAVADEIRKAEGKEKAERTPAEPKQPGRCHHCGEPTKGGAFVAGHDMKLKSLLLNAGREGDADAVAEYMARGWFKDAKTHKLDPAVVEAAEASDFNSGPWLDARTIARIGQGGNN